MIRARTSLLLSGVLLALWSGADAQEESGRSLGASAAVFFPPLLPIYGSRISDEPESRARFFSGRRLVAPDGMADFVSEFFYPALSTRLFVPELPGKLETRLQNYRVRRQQLVNALLDQFVTLHDATAPIREDELRAFAALQGPLIAALEAEAEQLRRDLIADGWRNRVDWNAGRRWKLGASSPRNAVIEAEAEFQIARAAVYYQDGLIPEQRGLLAELAHELRAVARKARGLPTARAESDAMYFSPATSRFRLPAELPAELREKIGRYNGQKAALKRELRDMVIEQEQAGPAGRTAAFAALADRQWPHFGLLEQLAEEIRVQLWTRMDAKPPPAPPWIPAGLLEFISAYNEQRDSYFGELRVQAERAAEAVPRVPFLADDDDRVQRQQDFAARQAAARRQATIAFQERNADRFAALQQRYKAIRDALTTVAGKQTDPKTGRALDADTLLRRYGNSMEEFEMFGREAAIYPHYRIAMLQPGLSVEQRRLLLGYALTSLAQPLPHGEILPRLSGRRPLPVP